MISAADDSAPQIAANWIAAIGGGGSLLIALAALFVAIGSKNKAAQANLISKEANKLGEEANRQSAISAEASAKSAEEAKRSAEMAQRADIRATESNDIRWNITSSVGFAPWTATNEGTDTAFQCFAILDGRNMSKSSERTDIAPGETIRFDLSEEWRAENQRIIDQDRANMQGSISIISDANLKLHGVIRWQTAGGTWHMCEFGKANNTPTKL